jgi:sulfide dehydrogenase subunit beta
MYPILSKKTLAKGVIEMVVQAPRVAKAHKPGQFLMVMNREESERIPLTIADSDPEKGTVTIVFLEVGRSTVELGEEFQVGDSLFSVLGPLGTPTHMEKLGTVVVVGGGLGVAPIYPICKGLKEAGNTVVSIVGYRTKGIMFWQDRIADVSSETIVCTDDGSFGAKGFVTQALHQYREAGRPMDRIIAIGPPVMMRAVSEMTKPWDVSTWVSLNTIMVDGTGMCGGCRVSVGDETKFVCVDGPDFDAHKVDWTEMFHRMGSYRVQEAASIHASEPCRLKLDEIRG